MSHQNFFIAYFCDMVELPSATSSTFLQPKFDGTSLLNQIRRCRKMHSWLFGKHKRKYITDNDNEMKFGPDVINNAANSL